jgi:hypothetical protein
MANGGINSKKLKFSVNVGLLVVKQEILANDWFDGFHYIIYT